VLKIKNYTKILTEPLNTSLNNIVDKQKHGDPYYRRKKHLPFKPIRSNLKDPVSKEKCTMRGVVKR